METVAETGGASATPADLDVRVKELEQYVASQSSPSAEDRAADQVSFTIIHISGIGSFELPSPEKIRIGLTVSLILLVVVLVVVMSVYRKPR